MKVEETHGRDFAICAQARHSVCACIEGWDNTTRMLRAWVIYRRRNLNAPATLNQSRRPTTNL